MGGHAHASKDEENREVDIEPAELAVLDAVGQEPRDALAQAREAAPQDHPATLAEVAALALDCLDGGAEPPDAVEHERDGPLEPVFARSLTRPNAVDLATELAEGVLQRRDEQRLLRGEVAIQRRLRDACRGGDAVHVDVAIRLLGKQPEGGKHDALAPVRGGSAGQM